MTQFEFSPKQKLVLTSPPDLFVDACPGAGKTQCLVERFVTRPFISDRRGVALVSFTNAAVEEVRRRCAPFPELLNNPNYTGTLDAFINQFVVGPIYRYAFGPWPSFRDVWSSVHGTNFVIKDSDVVFEMDWFDFSSSGNATMLPNRAPKDVRVEVKNLSRSQRAEASRHASTRHQELQERGYLSSGTSRSWLIEFLNNPVYAGLITDILSSRFGEMIVDEVQDCSKIDIQLLEFVRSAGVPLVVAGDLDQAIFSFRGSPDDLTRCQEFVKGFAKTVVLDENFRSSSVVCDINTRLRLSNKADVPSGRNAERHLPIHILEDDGTAAIRDKVARLIESEGFGLGEAVVVAFTRDHARRVAGGAAIPIYVSCALERLALAANGCQDFQMDTNRWTGRFGAALLGIARGEFQFRSESEFFAEVGITEIQFRDGCFRLANMQHPYAEAPEIYRQTLLDGLDLLGWSHWFDLCKLRVEDVRAWGQPPVPERQRLSWSTIHGFKGRQSPVVVLVIPEAHAYHGSALKHWVNELESDTRRVYYVGVSRAEQLLCIVVASTEYASLISILSEWGLPFIEHGAIGRQTTLPGLLG